MPQPIKIAAQRAMDLFYGNFRSNSDFFDLDDFAAHCGGVLGEYYNEKYEQARAEMRQEKRSEIIALDASILLPQRLKVIKKEGELYADLECPVMSFPYDEQGIGVQDIIAIIPKNGLKFERTTRSALYQLDYVPFCPVVWFYLVGERIGLVNKSTANLTEILVFTVPSVTSDKLMIPDAIVEHVITTAAMTIKQGVQGTVVKKASDQNPNKIIQTEANLPSSK